MKLGYLKTIVILLGLVGQDVWASLKITTWKTSKEASVYFVRAPEIPMVDVRLVFGAGSIRDGNKGGIAKTVNRLLLEGSGNLKAVQFKDKLALTGARLYTDSLREMASISLRTVKDEDYLKDSVELLKLSISKPRFDSQELKRTIEEIRLEQQLKEQSLSALADESLWRGIYRDHPYGNPPLGTYKSVGALTRKDLKEFFDRYYVNKNVVIAIVGDLESSEAVRLAESISVNMPIGERPDKVPEIPVGNVEKIIISKESTQTHIRLGQLGISREDTDYFPLLVGNHVLGGNSLVSILFREIREKRGLSYSTYSYFIPMSMRGPFVVGMQTENRKKEEALDILRNQLERFVAEGPSEEDLELAKANLIKGFPNRIDSNQKILGYLGMIGFYGLTITSLVPS